MKKGISVLCIIMLCFCSWVVIPIQQAEAVIPAALAVEMIPMVASILCAAGVAGITAAAVRDLVNLWYNEVGVWQYKDEIQQMYDYAVENSKVVISDNLWFDIRAWVQERFITIQSGLYHFENYGSAYMDFQLGQENYFPKTSYFTLSNMNMEHPIILEVTASDEMNAKLAIAIFGTEMDYYMGNVTLSYGLDVSSGIMEQILVDEGSVVQIIVNEGAIYTKYYYGTLSDPVLESDYWLYDITWKYDIPYLGDAVLGNPTWDFEVEGTRSIDLAPSIPAVVGLSAADIIAGEFPVVTEPLSPGITEEFFNVPDGGSINFQPLLDAAVGITEKFPFSLPWDLARGVSRLNGAAERPEFDLRIPILDNEYRIPVDLSIFEPLVIPVRVMLLIAFDVGMIFATRRLFGGAE